MLCQCTHPNVASSTSSIVRTWPLVGSANQFGLVEAVDRLGQRDIERSPTVPIDGVEPSSSSRSPDRTLVNCPGAGVGIGHRSFEADTAGPAGHLERVEEH